MKENWICNWETIPGDGEHSETFSTEAAAKLAMRKIIANTLDLSPYFSDLPPVSADFLKKYLSDPNFPPCDREIPKGCDDPENGMLILSPGYLSWEQYEGAHLRFDTDLLPEKRQDGEYHLDFWYENPTKAMGKGVKALSIRIRPQLDYGSSGYPLMVLFALGKAPLTQDQIAQRIWERWETVVDRKAVGRHLKLLKALGYRVQHTLEGYSHTGEIDLPDPQANFRSSAYALMIRSVLDGEPRNQVTIRQVVADKYGKSIDRKAVSRNLALLEAMDSTVRKHNGGYFITANRK